MIVDTDFCTWNIILEREMLTGLIPEEPVEEYDLVLILGYDYMQEIIRIIAHESEHLVIARVADHETSLEYDNVR